MRLTICFIFVILCYSVVNILALLLTLNIVTILAVVIIFAILTVKPDLIATKMLAFTSKSPRNKNDSNSINGKITPI